MAPAAHLGPLQRLGASHFQRAGGVSHKLELDLASDEVEEAREVMAAQAAAAGQPPAAEPPAADTMAGVWHRLKALCDARKTVPAGCLLGCQQLAGGARADAAAALQLVG
jgi:hypothetical protein